MNNNENSSCSSPKIQFNTLLNQSQINNQLVSTNNKQFTFKVDEYLYKHFSTFSFVLSHSCLPFITLDTNKLNSKQVEI